jgi:hypothetical protein
MAYYNKKDIEKYISENNDIIENRGHKPMTSFEHSMCQLNNEEDIVGFFWVDINEERSEKKVESAKVKLEGKTFVRIDFNLYTDDRFALDLYQSQAESKTVTQVIKERMIDQERAKKSIKDNKEDLENSLSEKITKKE